ncbi:MAG: FKBP-type peptidyl-prolyl cis-trans isomerase [Candidatus Thermoplasmatota archaeon]
MKVVKQGDKVSIVCEAKLETGEQCFENNAGNTLEIVVGEGKFFPSLESSLKDMKEGETKTITLDPAETFGSYRDDLIMDVPKTYFQNASNIGIGARIKVDAPSGKTYYATVIKLTDENITLDFNHPFAGKKIIITFTVISIQ